MAWVLHVWLHNTAALCKKSFLTKFIAKVCISLILCVLHHPKCALHHPKFYSILIIKRLDILQHIKTVFYNMGNKQNRRHHRNGYRHVFYRKKKRYMHTVCVYCNVILMYSHDSKAVQQHNSKLQQQNNSGLQQQQQQSNGGLQQQNNGGLQQQSSGESQQANTRMVTYEEAPECRIINLHLLSRHIEDVTQHVATCSACHMVARSSDTITVVGEIDRYGLASIMGCKFKGCGQQLIFNTSTTS